MTGQTDRIASPREHRELSMLARKFATTASFVTELSYAPSFEKKVVRVSKPRGKKIDRAELRKNISKRYAKTLANLAK